MFPWSTPGAKTLIVARNIHHSKEIHRALGLEAIYCEPGAMLSGRYNKIIIFDGDYHLSEVAEKLKRRWLEEARCRLVPEGDLFYV